MAVKIRLARFGKKRRAFYRIVVSDSRSPRDGRFIEQVGLYDPAQVEQKDKVTLEADRVRDWLSKGAIPTETVRSILKHEGILGSGAAAASPAEAPAAPEQPAAE